MKTISQRLLASVLVLALASGPSLADFAPQPARSFLPHISHSDIFQAEALNTEARWYAHLLFLSRSVFEQTRLPAAISSRPRLAWALKTGVSAGLGWLLRRHQTLQTILFGMMASPPGKNPTATGGELSPALSTASEINLEAASELQGYLQHARSEKGLFGLLSVAMEMRPVDKQGKKLRYVGPGGGGQAVFMEEQPAAVGEEGVASAIMSVIPYANVMQNRESMSFDEAFGEYLSAHEGRKLMTLDVRVGNGSIPLAVGYIKQGEIPVLQICDPTGNLFNELYGRPQPDSIGAYVESVLLPRAAIEIQRHLGLQFEIMQFNDWQTALGPVFLKEQYGGRSWLLGHRPASALTIHNLEYQGNFPNVRFAGRSRGTMRFEPATPKDPQFADLQTEGKKLHAYLRTRGVVGDEEEINVFTLTGLPAKIQTDAVQGMEFWGHHNLLKGGILNADRIIFVSNGHREEGETPERGYGLDELLRGVKEKTSFVYNGIHAQNHRPENLAALDESGTGHKGLLYRFIRPLVSLAAMTARELISWKRDNKLALQAKIGLEVGEQHIILGFVTRLVKQKGLNILAQKLGDGKTLLEHLLDIRDPESGGKVQIPILGSRGDERGDEQVAFFENFLKEHPQYEGQFAFINDFNFSLAKQIGAGGDLMGMWSIDEPGGIANQEIALLLCFVLATNRGGLKDFKENNGTPFGLANGFEIDEDIDQIRRVVAHEYDIDPADLRVRPGDTRLSRGDPHYRHQLALAREVAIYIANLIGTGSKQAIAHSFWNSVTEVELAIKTVNNRKQRYSDYASHLDSLALRALVNAPHIRQRLESSSQILKEVTEFMRIYHHDPKKYGDWLSKLTQFNPDWGRRAWNYVDIYLDTISKVSPGFRFQTRTVRRKARQAPEVDEFLKEHSDSKDPGLLANGRFKSLLEEMRNRPTQFFNQRTLVVGPASGLLGLYAVLLGAQEVVVMDSDRERLANVNRMAAGEGRQERVTTVLRDLANEPIDDLGLFDNVIVMPASRSEPDEIDVQFTKELFGRVLRHHMDPRGFALAFIPNVPEVHAVMDETALEAQMVRYSVNDMMLLEIVRRQKFPGRFIPGAAGLTAWLFRTKNLIMLGMIEGFAQSWLGLEAFQSHHAPLFFTVAVITLFLFHFLTGVVVNENEEPVRYDVGLSVKATFTALSGFAGWPLMAVGLATPGPLGLALSAAGFVVGPLLHGSANQLQDLEFSKAA